MANPINTGELSDLFNTGYLLLSGVKVPFCDLIYNKVYENNSQINEFAQSILNSPPVPSTIESIARAYVYLSEHRDENAGTTETLKALLEKTTKIMVAHFNLFLQIKNEMNVPSKRLPLSDYIVQMETIIETLNINKEYWENLKQVYVQNNKKKITDSWNAIIAEIRAKVGFSNTDETKEFLENPLTFVPPVKSSRSTIDLSVLQNVKNKLIEARLPKKQDFNFQEVFQNYTEALSKRIPICAGKIKKFCKSAYWTIRNIVEKVNILIFHPLEPLPKEIHSAEYHEKLSKVETKIDALILHLNDDPWSYRLTFNDICFLIGSLKIATKIAPSASLSSLIQKLEAHNLLKKPFKSCIILPMEWDLLQAHKDASLYRLGSSKITQLNAFESELSALLLTPDSYPKPAPEPFSLDTATNAIEVFNLLGSNKPVEIPPEKFEDFILFLSKPHLVKSCSWPRLPLNSSINSRLELNSYLSKKIDTPIVDYLHLFDSGVDELINKIQAGRLTQFEWNKLTEMFFHPSMRNALHRFTTNDSILLIKFRAIYDLLIDLQEQYSNVDKVHPEDLLNTIQDPELKGMFLFLDKLNLRSRWIDWSEFSAEELALFITSISFVNLIPNFEKNHLFDHYLMGDIQAAKHLLLKYPNLDCLKPHKSSDFDSILLTRFKIVSPLKLCAKLDYLLALDNFDHISFENRLSITELTFIRKEYRNCPLPLPPQMLSKILRFQKKFLFNEKQDFIHLIWQDETRSSGHQEDGIFERITSNLIRYSHASYKVSYRNTDSKDIPKVFQTCDQGSVKTSLYYMQYFYPTTSFRTPDFKEYRISYKSLAQGIPRDLRKEFKNNLKKELINILATERKIALSDLAIEVPLKILINQFNFSTYDLNKTEFKSEMICSEYCVTALIKATIAAYDTMIQQYPERMTDIHKPKDMEFFGFSKSQQPDTLTPASMKKHLKNRGIIKNLSAEFVPLKKIINY
ncbi:MAG: hypothetical protein WC222_08465 [Parachlamydiales bacterium]|jgi:hypothetical protein